MEGENAFPMTEIFALANFVYLYFKSFEFQVKNGNRLPLVKELPAYKRLKNYD